MLLNNIFFFKCIFRNIRYLHVSMISNWHLLPAMQRLCQRDLVYLDQLPISFRQNAVTDATWREDRGNVFERLSQAVAHFVYVIPLLLGHRCTHVVRRHLSFVEQPLENEQGGYESNGTCEYRFEKNSNREILKKII